MCSSDLQAAEWLERPNREEEEQSEKMLDLLQFKSGETVADIGAGTGYHARRIAKRVGSQGKVFAVDIQPEMLQLLTNRMAELQITNVIPVLGEISDPKLAPNSLDTILLVDVYHEFSHPFEMTRAMARALKPGGHFYMVANRGLPYEPVLKAHFTSFATLADNNKFRVSRAIR